MPLPVPADTPIPFVTMTNWVKAATLCGVDIGRIFQEAGLDIGKIHPETALIHRDAILLIMERCVDETRARRQGQHFPLVLGETFAFEYLADVETFITTSPTLREATRANEWIPALINPYMHLALAEHGDEARITLSFAHPEACPRNTWHFAEATFASMVKFSRLLLGGQPLFGRVTFQHPEHAEAEACRAYFHTPVTFGEPLNALWFDRALLDQPLRGAFPSLHEQAARRVAQRVAERAAPPSDTSQAGALIEQIERLLRNKTTLLGLGLEGLSAELRLHPRTLQRRLREAGQSHSAILDRVRYDLAQRWLADPGLSVEEVSDRLGFSDRRSFTQAFSRWSGLTPTQWRQQPARHPDFSGFP